MKFGRADRRITVQRATYAANNYGEQVPTWATLATVWAELTRTTGIGEKIEGGQDVATQTIAFKVRSSSDSRAFKADDRVVYNSKNWDIIGIEEIGRNDALVITCKSTTT